jgi:hypothetical protein
VALLNFETFAVEFRGQLGYNATKSLYRLRMATGGLVLGTIVVAALMWLIVGPGIAFWVYVLGGCVLVVLVVVGLRGVLSKASTHQGKRVTIGDLTRMGALVSGGRTNTGSQGGSTH